MPSTTFRRLAGAFLVLGTLAGDRAWADHAPPVNAIAGPADAGGRHPISRGGPTGRRGAGTPDGSGGWWLGTAGIALALAVCGGVSVAARRYLPAKGGSNLLRVVGRASLSPKQAVYLLEVGDRVLIVGAGPQGPPSLLGELPAGGGDPGPRPIVPQAGRFDRRVGDDE